MQSQLQKYAPSADESVGGLHQPANNLVSATISPIAANVINVKSASVVHPPMTENKPQVNQKMSGTLTYFPQHHQSQANNGHGVQQHIVRNQNQ